MVRTAGTTIKKTTGGKSTKSSTQSRGSSNVAGTSRKQIGGNKQIARATPQWQKSIGNFLDQNLNRPESPKDLTGSVKTEEKQEPLAKPASPKEFTVILESGGDQESFQPAFSPKEYTVVFESDEVQVPFAIPTSPEHYTIVFQSEVEQLQFESPESLKEYKAAFECEEVLVPVPHNTPESPKDYTVIFDSEKVPVPHNTPESAKDYTVIFESEKIQEPKNIPESPKDYTAIFESAEEQVPFQTSVSLNSVFVGSGKEQVPFEAPDCWQPITDSFSLTNELRQRAEKQNIIDLGNWEASGGYSEDYWMIDDMNFEEAWENKENFPANKEKFPENITSGHDTNDIINKKFRRMNLYDISEEDLRDASTSTYVPKPPPAKKQPRKSLAESLKTKLAEQKLTVFNANMNTKRSKFIPNYAKLEQYERDAK